MKKSMETSELMRYRIANVVPERADKMQRAIIQKDFKTFAELTMKDSNQMHAICLDTYPPFTYMNNISHSIINFVHSYNDAMDDVKACINYEDFSSYSINLLCKLYCCINCNT